MFKNFLSKNILDTLLHFHFYFTKSWVVFILFFAEILIIRMSEAEHKIYNTIQARISGISFSIHWFLKSKISNK